MADYIINLTGNICELFIILFFLKDNYKIKYSKKIFVISCVFLVLFQFMNTSVFLAESSFVMLGALLFTFMTTLLYNIKMLHRILFSVFIFILNGLSEIIVGMLLASVFEVDISVSQKTPLLFAFGTLTSKFLTYFLILLTKKKWFLHNNNPIKRKFLLILFLPLSTFLFMIVMLRYCYLINETNFHIVMLVTSIVLMLSNVAVFFVINEQNELIETKEKLLFAELHIKYKCCTTKNFTNTKMNFACSDMT